MKRDWGKIRDVLQAVEEDRLIDTMNTLSSSGERDEIDIFCGHLLLCLDAKYVDGILVRVDSRNEWRWSVPHNPVRLTMEGQDMLERLRKPAIPRPKRHAGVGAG